MASIPSPGSELLREPNLLIPGKKPVGAVKIDSQHYGAPSRLWLYQHNKSIELVRGTIGTETAIIHTIKNGQKCAQKQTPGSPRIDYNDDASSIDGRAFSMMVAMSTAVSATNDYIVSLGDSGSNNPIGGFNQESNTFIRAIFRDQSNNTQTVTSSTVINDGSIHVAVLVHTDSYLRLWVDGVYEGEDTTSTGAVTFDQFNGFLLRRIASCCQWDGEIYSVALIPRVLSDSQAKELSTDPYQFLIPS